MAITITGGAKGEKSPVSPAPFISTSFLPSSSEIHTVLYQRFMLQEAIKDVSAAITKGILSNSAPCEFAGNPTTTTTSPSSRQGRSATAPKPTAYISALDRLEKLQEGSKQIKTLFQEFATLTESSTTIGGTSMVAARAAASKELFMRECEVEDEDEVVTPSKKVDAAASNGEVAEEEKSKETLQAMKKEIAPLQKILKDLQQVTRLPGFQYEASIHKAKTGKAPAASSAQSLHLLQKRLEETLGGVMRLLEAAAAVATNRGKPVGGGNASSSSSSFSPVTIRPQVLRDITTWPAQFIQIVQQSANIKPLEVLTEPKREQLRRIAFDVEELQHDQEQAVTDGDMQKSEQLYFEQTDLLEGMKPCFEELESVIKKFKSDRGEAMLNSLKLFKQSFSPQYALAVAREEKAKSRKDGDRGRLVHRRGLVEKARKEQKAGLAVYLTEWEKMYDQTVRQQTACFQAMDELEKRIASLAGDQAILIQDRLEKVNTERERALDAAAFYHFCDRRQAEVQVAQKNVDVSTQILKDVGSSIEFGINQLDNFLTTCIRDHAQEEYVQLQKEKLDQFRELYITLGDLLFKKARSADEIEKRIEYYSLQQEVAMDALNPKAKEYSQAKKKWVMVRQELEKQLKALEEKSAKEASDFEPTAALLLKNGVSFTHPVEEVARRNKVREQKLLEYKELMDEKVEEQRKREEALRDAAGGGPERGASSADDTGMGRGIPIRDDDEVVLAEKMRKEEEEAAAILAVSARFHSSGVAVSPSVAVAGAISSTTVSTPSSPPRSTVPKARLTSMDFSNTTSKHTKGDKKK